MKIVIDPFDKKSIATALSQVKQYQRDFKKKEQEFLRRLAELGVKVAKAGYETADYDGNGEADVRLIKTGDGYTIEAFGYAVGFLEFGTGVRYREWDNSNMEYTPPKHGTYGKQQGKNPKGWFYAPGAHSYGNPPAEAMKLARDMMIERVVQIAREVWK